MPKRKGPAYLRPPKVFLGLKSRRDGFDLGVVVEHFLAHLTAPAGLLVSAEGQRGVEDVMAIDPDSAGADAPGHLVGGAQILRPDTSRKSIYAVVGFARDAIQVGGGK